MSIELTLGKIVVTPGALESVDPGDVMRALTKHHRGDWGELGKDDWAANNLALDEGLRILSAYRDQKGTKFWVITEADRSATTVLLPDEY